MDVTKISFPSGIDADDLAFSSLIAQMAGDYAYFGAGSLSDAEIASLDSAFAWDTALAANFNSLGELAESAAKVESKLSTLRSRKYRLPGRRASSISLTLAGISQLQKKYLESSAFSSTPITIILRSRGKSEVVIFNGLRWTCDWSGEVDGLFQVVISAEFHGSTTGKIYTVANIPATGIFMINDMLPFAAWSGATTPTQSFRLAAYQVPAPITLTAPTGFHISTSESSGYAAELTLPATFNGTIYTRLVSTTKGAHSGNLTAASSGAATKTSAVSGFLGGGTETNPYPVSTAADLAAVADDLTAHYIQLSDITLTSAFTPLGSKLADTPFTGVYDGQGFSITGLEVANSDANQGVGLFSYTSGATIANLSITGNITGDGYVGGLVGYAHDTTITACHAITSIIAAGNDAGGLIGVASECAISACSASASILSSAYDTGALVARFSNGTIELSHALAAITVSAGSINVGGLVGYLSSSTIQTSWAAGKIAGSGMEYAAGLVGYAEIITITNCFSHTRVAAVASNASAGLVACIVFDAKLTACFSTGKVEPSVISGGLIADVSLAYPTITDCFWDTTISGFTTSGSDEIGHPTSDLWKEATFTNWDFTSIWTIREGLYFPTLQDNPE